MIKINKISNSQYTVNISSNGERLDKYLAETSNSISRTRIKMLIENSYVKVEDKTITDPSYRVKSGQRILFEELPSPKKYKLKPQAIPLDVVFEDNDLIVVNKPSGLVVHPAPGNPDHTLVNALMAHCGDSLSGIGGEQRPGIVHRLDKDTSGLLVAAKNDFTHVALSRLFETRQLKRSYHALVWGSPPKVFGKVLGKIGRNPKDRKTMAVVTKGGKIAETHYKKLERFGEDVLSLLECTLKTGRTHQIRVHMAHIGHPVVGDASYGRLKQKNLKMIPLEHREVIQNFNRQALHSNLLSFTHPTTGLVLRFESPLPSDITHLLRVARTL